MVTNFKNKKEPFSLFLSYFILKLYVFICDIQQNLCV